jgi:hypothetical protein
MTSVLLLHLPDHLSRHRGVEIDCVVPQALSCLVTLPTPAFEWLADSNLCSVAVLRMVFYAIHVLWRGHSVTNQMESQDVCQTGANLHWGPDGTCGGAFLVTGTL